jgi:hypothetical protein
MSNESNRSRTGKSDRNSGSGTTTSIRELLEENLRDKKSADENPRFFSALLY